MKRYILMPILWVVLLFANNASAHAQQTSGYCGRQVVYNADSTNLQWNFDAADSLLTISGSGRMYDYTMDTKAPWYVWREGIKRVVIGDGVTVIGTYAFYNISMNSVTFGNTLETIREYGFWQCYSLQRLDFPASLQYIEREAFSSNSNLKVIDFGASEAIVGSYAFGGASALQSLLCSKVKELQWSCFENCGQLTTIQLGDSLKRIDGNVFRYAQALRRIDIPASVTHIEGSFLSYTTTLDTIVVAPANTVYNSNGDCNAIIRTADNMLIAGCRSTVIPAIVQSIGNSAFEGCSGLQTIVFPDGLQRIYSNAFCYCSGLQTLVFPNGLQSIEGSAFYYCTALQTVTLPDGLQYLGGNAFYGCTALQSANYPNSIQSAECNIFTNCPSLTTPVYNDKIFACLPKSFSGAYVVPNTIQTICCGAFSGCSQVTSITLPDNLTFIPSVAFDGCSALTSLVIPDAVTTIGSSAFTGCSSLSSISIPANLQTIDGNVFSGCSKLKHITWNAKDARLSWIFYDPSYTEEYIRESMSWYHPFYDCRKQIQTFTLGDSVRVIPRYLCYEMENITSLTFGEEVDSIELHAFDGCKRIASVTWNAKNCNDPLMYSTSPLYPFRNSISSITFGEAVEHIPAYLCHGMSRIHHLHIPEHVSSIGAYAFRYLNALDSISVDGFNVTYDSRNHCNALIETATDNLMLGCYKTRIPDDIRSIGDCAFRNVRGLRNVVVPEGVTYIGVEAFNGCLDLDTIVLPSSLTAFSDYVFQDCSSLDTLALPDSLEFIGIRALSNCSGLANLTLPEAMDHIDQNAFFGCSGLEYIDCFASTPPSAMPHAFRGTSCPIYVPCPSIEDYRSAPVWKDLIVEYQTPTGIAYAPRVLGMFDWTLNTMSNDYYWGWDTIYQQPDCETNAIIYAEPYSGYEFVAWTDTLGNTVSTDASYEFYVDEDIKLIAVFKQKEGALDNVDAHTKIWVKAQEVMVLSDRDAYAVLYDIVGREVDACATMADVVSSLHAPAAGIYITVIDGRQQKVIVQ